MIKHKCQTLIFVILTVASGCDDRLTEVALEAAGRQAQQNTAMAKLNQEVASGSRQLVAADAQARKEIVSVHRELQTERSRLNGGWNSLEQERRSIAAQRRTESVLVPLIKLFGGVALVTVVLAFSWYALAAARNDRSVAELNALLIREVLDDESSLLSARFDSKVLLGHTPQNRPSE